MNFEDIDLFDLLGKIVTNTHGYPFVICEFTYNFDHQMILVGLGDFDKDWRKIKHEAHTWIEANRIFGESSGWKLYLAEYKGYTTGEEE